MKPTLIIFGGLPATGKTTIARELARQIGAVHLRIDTIEQAIRDCGARGSSIEKAGYVVAYAIAEDNLRIGRTVIADSANTLRSPEMPGWQSQSEPACPESRSRSDVLMLQNTAVASKRESRTLSARSFRRGLTCYRREYHPWSRDHIVVDTHGVSVEKSVEQLRKLLASFKPKT